MWLWKDLMSKRARLNVSVLLFLERVVTEVILDQALAVWIRGCYVSNRNVCVTLQAWSPLALGWRRKALYKIFTEALINLVVTRLLPFVRVRGVRVEDPWVPCWVPRRRLGASWALGHQPGALQCPRPPSAAASSLPWAVAWLQQMFLRFWLKSVFLVCECSLSLIPFLIFMFSQKNVTFVSSKGLKCLLQFLFFSAFIRSNKKCFLSSSRPYRVEIREQSVLSWGKHHFQYFLILKSVCSTIGKWCHIVPYNSKIYPVFLKFN